MVAGCSRSIGRAAALALAIAFHHPCGLDSRPVVGEAFFRGQARHPHTDAGLLGVALRVFSTDLSDSADCRVEQDDINTVRVLRLLFSLELPVRPSLHAASIVPHFSQMMLTPSLLAPRSGSPRN